MFTKLAPLLTLAIGGIAETTHPGDVSGYQVLIWAGCGYLAMAAAVKIKEFYDSFIRPHPDPRTTYATKEELALVVAQVKECASAEDLDEGLSRIEKTLNELKTDTDKRHTAAKESREKMHGQIAEIGKELATFAAQLAHITQHASLEALAASFKRRNHE